MLLYLFRFSKFNTLCSWWRSSRASAPATSLASSSALIRAFISVTQLVRSRKSAVKRCSLEAGQPWNHKLALCKLSLKSHQQISLKWWSKAKRWKRLPVGVIEASMSLRCQGTDLLPVGNELISLQVNLRGILGVCLLQTVRLTAKSVYLKTEENVYIKHTEWMYNACTFCCTSASN